MPDQRHSGLGRLRGLVPTWRRWKMRKNTAIFKGQADGHGQEMLEKEFNVALGSAVGQHLPLSCPWRVGILQVQMRSAQPTRSSMTCSQARLLELRGDPSCGWEHLQINMAAHLCKLQRSDLCLEDLMVCSSKPKCFARGLFHHCLHG